jgi:hypothetical protein
MMSDNETFSGLTKIIQKIHAELYYGITCIQTLKPILYNQDRTQKFNNTYSAHVFNYMQHALVNDGISCVWRLWDKADDSNSIPSLIKKLDAQQNINAIKNRRREAMLDRSSSRAINSADNSTNEEIHETFQKMAEKDANEAALSVDNEFSEIKKQIADQELCGLLNRSKDWRDRHIAHNLEITKKEKKDGIRTAPIMWGDLERTIELTAKIVPPLGVLVDDVSTFPDDVFEHYEIYSNAFWDGMKDVLK